MEYRTLGGTGLGVSEIGSEAGGSAGAGARRTTARRCARSARPRARRHLLRHRARVRGRAQRGAHRESGAGRPSQGCDRHQDTAKDDAVAGPAARSAGGDVPRGLDREMHRVEPPQPRTDVIDVQQLHAWTPPYVERLEWYEALDRLRRQGKIRAFGVSANDWDPYGPVGLVRSGRTQSVQVIYNIFEQRPAEELLPAASEHGVGIIVRVPFEEGLLSGAFAPDTASSQTTGGRVVDAGASAGGREASGRAPPVPGSGSPYPRRTGSQVRAGSPGGFHRHPRDAQRGARGRELRGFRRARLRPPSGGSSRRTPSVTAGAIRERGVKADYHRANRERWEAGAALWAERADSRELWRRLSLGARARPVRPGARAPPRRPRQEGVRARERETTRSSSPWRGSAAS